MRLAPTKDSDLAMRIALWMGKFLEEVWQSPEFSEAAPPLYYRAALRFLLGCELVRRCGNVPELAYLGGTPESPALAQVLGAVEEKLSFWDACSRERGFNPFVNLLCTWEKILSEIDDPETGVLSALRVPFHLGDPQGLDGFVGACTYQLHRFGEWFSLGFVKVHRWVDSATPHGPDRRVDWVSMVLAATYAESAAERCLMAAIFASVPRNPDPDWGIRVSTDSILVSFDWARRYASKYPCGWELLVAEIEAERKGPGISALCEFYSNDCFANRATEAWREALLEVSSRYTKKRIPADQLPSWSRGLALLRETLDFAVWAGLIQSHLSQKQNDLAPPQTNR
jgi:hypothetical protein